MPRSDVNKRPLRRLSDMVEARSVVVGDVVSTDKAEQRLKDMRQVCRGLRRVFGSASLLHQLLCTEEDQLHYFAGACDCG
jgi:hypothetical protein